MDPIWLFVNYHPGTVIDNYSWHRKFLSTPMAAVFFRSFFSLGVPKPPWLSQRGPQAGSRTTWVSSWHNIVPVIHKLYSFLGGENTMNYLGYNRQSSTIIWLLMVADPLVSKDSSKLQWCLGGLCGLACILGLISPNKKISLISSERSASSEWCSPKFEDWSFCISLGRKTDSVPQDKKLPRPLPTYLFSDPFVLTIFFPSFLDGWFLSLFLSWWNPN